MSIAFGRPVCGGDELARIVFADNAAPPKTRDYPASGASANTGSPRSKHGARKIHPLAVVVIPLLFETQAETYFDKIICVACPGGPPSIQRLLARGWTPEQIGQRIAAQMPVDGKGPAAPIFVVWTEGDLGRATTRQLERIFSKL